MLTPSLLVTGTLLADISDTSNACCGGIQAFNERDTGPIVTNVNRKSPVAPARQTVQSRLRLTMFAAFMLPMLAVVALQSWLVHHRETQSANQLLIERAGAGASILELLARNHTFESITDLIVATENESAVARDAIRAWSTQFMRMYDAIGIALLDAQGNIVHRWPTELAVDFAPQKIDTESVPAVYTFEFSESEGALSPIPIDIAVAPVNRGPGLAPIAYVVAAFQPPDVWAKTASQILPLMGLLAIGALVTSFIVLRNIWKNITGPLATIARQIATQPPSGSVDPVAYTTIELERIALSFGALNEELHESRRQSVVLERRAESNAAVEKKKVQQLLNRARKDAERDSLTGLTNRRFIEERLEPIYREQVSQRVNVVLAMFDVDNFKPLNDTEGHAAGDEILRFFGELLRGSLRADDVGIRYGGDEFAAVLMGISNEQAHDICERIVKMFNRQIATMNIKTKVTLSSGFASRSATGATSATELLAQADAALYDAKRSGKGCVAEFQA